MSSIPPHDPEAESSLIGAMLLSPAAIISAMEICRPEDFYSPNNANAYAAICRLTERGVAVDSLTTAAEMGDNNFMVDLMSMMNSTPSPNNARFYAEIVVRHSVARQMIHQFGDSTRGLYEGGDPYALAEDAGKFISELGSLTSGGPESVTIGELSMTADRLAPVVIPGMMHSDYRTIVVAEEGTGKSLILRTIAMSAAQGFHPFSHQRIEPIKALVVDLENPAQAILQTALPFAQHLFSRTDDYDDDRFRMWRRPGGIDIRRLSDRAELQREIAFHRPQLVCIGPIYKMYQRAGGESYEDSADSAMAVLDDLRTKYGFALLLEHHAAKGKQGEKRDLSPMGSQRWMAWPEVGISLYKDAQDPTVLNVKRYRGDRLTGVDWPDTIVRDSTWLFDGVWGPRGR